MPTAARSVAVLYATSLYHGHGKNSCTGGTVPAGVLCVGKRLAACELHDHFPKGFFACAAMAYPCRYGLEALASHVVFRAARESGPMQTHAQQLCLQTDDRFVKAGNQSCTR